MPSEDVSMASAAVNSEPRSVSRIWTFRRMGFEASDRIQYINGAVIYPAEYFCPLDYETKQLNITDNTVSIHHYNASWITEEEIELKKKVNEYRKQHGRIRTIIYKNICEYQMENRRVKISLIV